MVGNDPSPDRIPPIERDELIEYSGRPNYRVRLFYKTKNSLLDMAEDGFLGRDNNGFYILLDSKFLDSKLEKCRYLKSGEIIGIQTEGMIGFEPRRLVI